MTRMGFFTDTSVCIGCKACEVACKEWNHVPEDGLALTGMSYDNSVGLGADTWRHVAFIEQRKPVADGQDQFRWLMASDVCKHCTHAACLDVCPTGALFRTEFGTVVVQEDVCNGCGYCVPACPYGVIDRRQDDGRAWKCTLCYDRLGDGLEPACAKACPTESIKFGEIGDLRKQAEDRVAELHRRGMDDAVIYDSSQSSVGGTHAMFIVRGDPRTFNLPPTPEVPTIYLKKGWRSSAIAAGLLLGGTLLAFLSDSARGDGRNR